MSYSETINYLYSLQKFGLKFGLKNTEALLSALGRPDRDYLTIHIAGTNGKGSTSATVATLLNGLGLKTGLFTSPHMVRFTERIKIFSSQDSLPEEISEKDVIRLTELIRSRLAEDINPTFFEFITALAFKYFSERKIDIAVVEVGMGGRLDATNVINPSVSVITKIGLDHKEFLGETLREIAMEKAGIIKRCVPVVSALQEHEAMAVIKKKTIEMNGPLYIYGQDFRGSLREMTPRGLLFDYEDERYTFKDLFTPLTGVHQLENACLAIKAFLLFLEQQTRNLGAWKLGSAEAFHSTALQHFCSNIKHTCWPGRLELFKTDGVLRKSNDFLGSPEGMHFLFDGAHNPQAAQKLSEALRDIYRKLYKRIILILGIMADKDIDGIVRAFDGICDIVITTRPDYKRALEADKLKKKIEALHTSYSSSIYNAETVREAIEMAGDFYIPGDLIVITGSFYTVGEAKVVLGERESLRTLRESMERKVGVPKKRQIFGGTSKV